ncbi:hypothetical protein C8J57DRAFT_147696, partial [Mycena rebaudengoi]
DYAIASTLTPTTSLFSNRSLSPNIAQRVRPGIALVSNMNPDMQGYVVRVSNFVTHSGIAILIAWSNKDPRYYYGILFLQMVFILIAVLISVRRDELSIGDAEFAVTLTRSPLSAYCVLLVLPRLLMKTLSGRATSVLLNLKLLPTDPETAWSQLTTELHSQPVTDGLYAVLIIFLCLTLNISVQLNDFTHFYSSEDSVQLDLHRATGSDIVHKWLVLGGISLVMYECILARHQKLRWELMRTLAARHPSIRHSFYWKRGVCGFCATWYIAAKLHPWIPFLYAAIMFQDWSSKLSILTVENDFDFSYGQFLALAPAVPVAWQCLKLAIRRRSDIVRIPQRFLWDVVWIVSGKGTPWGEDEPKIDDVWNTFPADVVPVEPGLPFSAPTESVTTRKSCRRRNRSRNRRRGSRELQGDLPSLQIDLGEIPLHSVGDFIPLIA